MNRYTTFLFAIVISAVTMTAQKTYSVASPSGNLEAIVTAGEKLTYEVKLDGNSVIAPSALAMQFSDGTIVGEKCKVRKAARRSVNETVASPLYRSDSVTDSCNELKLNLGKGWFAEFRVYNDAVAYRFVNKSKHPFKVVDETVEYCFNDDCIAAVPFVRTGRPGDFESQFMNSFENTYTCKNISRLDKGRLFFLPAAVALSGGVKVAITEVNLENYPGLYLNTNADGTKFKGVFAPYPETTTQGGYLNLQEVVTERGNYIAQVNGSRAFPWRVAVVTSNDCDLAASDITYLLAEPSRIADTSWIRPGKVAWEWWNDWNLSDVDFVTGVNDDTYKAYIDFAADNNIEYVILDDGWSESGKADLFDVVESISLEELVEYGEKRNVGIILWAGYLAFSRDMERVCRHYSEMGIKGFKIDFMDRDDQLMTDFNYRAAEMAARYHLVLDLHGTHKPAGLTRTYPNVLNMEGVNGLEQMKWSPETLDQVQYDVMIPFLRQLAGPMDYTQGAMLNAARGCYRPCNSEPMSQGTRCRQLALYVVLDSPLNMLCDSPSNYRREQECTDYISAIPTVWDETRILQGRLGEFIVTARRKGDTWFVGGITDRSAREITIDIASLGITAPCESTIYRDGANAHRLGRDYRCERRTLSPAKPLTVTLAPGGGFAMRIN